MNGKFRTESDLLGELQVPAEAYYGVQTQRALNNYKISTTRMCDYPDYVIAMACIKLAAAQTNKELGALDPDIADAHDEGIIHFHDADYFAQHMHNCDLVNLEDMLQNGTVISGTRIDRPHSFSTACNIATQIIAQVASCQ